MEKLAIIISMLLMTACGEWDNQVDDHGEVICKIDQNAYLCAKNEQYYIIDENRNVYFANKHGQEL